MHRAEQVSEEKMRIQFKCCQKLSDILVLPLSKEKKSSAKISTFEAGHFPNMALVSSVEPIIINKPFMGSWRGNPSEM